MRRLTHPQESEKHPTSYPKPRPSSNIIYSGMSSSTSPQFCHSTSLGSIAVEGCIQESGEADELKTMSRPDLHQFLKGEATAIDGVNANSNSPTEFQPRCHGPVSPGSIHLVLMGAQSLVKQIEYLSSEASSSVPRESTPSKESDQKLLNKSISTAKRLMCYLQQFSESLGETRRQPISHSSSYTTNLSRVSSLGSESAAVATERDQQLDSIQNEPGQQKVIFIIISELITGQKLEFPVVTYLGHLILSPPRRGLNALHYRTFSPILYQKSGET